MLPAIVLRKDRRKGHEKTFPKLTHTRQNGAKCLVLQRVPKLYIIMVRLKNGAAAVVTEYRTRHWKITGGGERASASGLGLTTGSRVGPLHPTTTLFHVPPRNVSTMNLRATSSKEVEERCLNVRFAFLPSCRQRRRYETESVHGPTRGNWAGMLRFSASSSFRGGEIEFRIQTSWMKEGQNQTYLHRTSFAAAAASSSSSHGRVLHNKERDDDPTFVYGSGGEGNTSGGHAVVYV